MQSEALRGKIQGKITQDYFGMSVTFEWNK